VKQLADPACSPSTISDELEHGAEFIRSKELGSVEASTLYARMGKIQQETAYHKLPRLTGVKKPAGACGWRWQQHRSISSPLHWHKQTLLLHLITMCYKNKTRRCWVP